MLRGRQSEASVAWEVLGVDPADREKIEIELEAAGTTRSSARTCSQRNDSSSTHGKDLVRKRSLFDVFAPDVRSRTALAIFLLFMQQLSGIDGVLYVCLSPSSSIPFSVCHGLRLCLFVQVRTTSFYASRSFILRSLLSSFRRVWGCHLCCDDPCPDFCR